MNHGSVAGLKCSATYRFFKVYESNPKPLENPHPHDSTNSKTDLLGLTRNLVVPVSAPAPAGPGSASSIQTDAQTDAGRLNSRQIAAEFGRLFGLVFNRYLLDRHCIVLHKGGGLHLSQV